MMDTQHYPFALPPLPYPYAALEPYIDEETMHYHHDKHFKTYIDNLNKVLTDYPQYHKWTLAQLLQSLSVLPTALQTPIRNNAGGVYNHDLYFDSLAPRTTRPSRELVNALESQFNSLEGFADKLKDAALSVFGSGWGWLVEDTKGKLHVMPSANQDSPISQGFTPLLPLDVWEHAYYLEYKNLRADYLDALFHIIDWANVSQRMKRAAG